MKQNLMNRGGGGDGLLKKKKRGRQFRKWAWSRGLGGVRSSEYWAARALTLDFQGVNCGQPLSSGIDSTKGDTVGLRSVPMLALVPIIFQVVPQFM